jgi:hypothetical protein
LTKRVLKAGELAGMKPSPSPKVVSSAAAWAQGGGPVDETMLRRWGFVAGIAEQMVTPGNPNRYGLSAVVEFSPAASAKADVKAFYTSNGPWTRFAVSGIPSAVGFEQSGSGMGGRNVGFSVGPYAYTVGVGWQAGAKNAVWVTALRNAALLLYHRVSAG